MYTRYIYRFTIDDVLLKASLGNALSKLLLIELMEIISIESILYNTEIIQTDQRVDSTTEKCQSEEQIRDYLRVV